MNRDGIIVLLICLATTTFAQVSDWVISTSDAVVEHAGITVANGQMGLVMDRNLFQTKEVILGGQYEKGPDNGISRVLKGFDFMNLLLKIDGKALNNSNTSEWQQQLNMQEAFVQTQVNYQNLAKLTHRIYALQTQPYAALVEMEVIPNKDMQLQVMNDMASHNQIVDAKYSYRQLEDMGHTMQIAQAKGASLFGKYDLAAATTFLFENQKPNLTYQQDKLGFTISLKKGQAFRFALVGGMTSTANFTDALNEAERQPIFILLQGWEKTLNRHKAAWKNLWENDIIIEGDTESQRDVRSALYHLFSFARANSNESIAPMGLSAQGYNGHIFWDTELWMFPVFAIFDQSVAKSLLEYRYERLPQAKQKAYIYGYDGAMFPWESDDTGEEATPTWALTGTAEHHITADIAIAFWNYYTITKDKKWLGEKGFEVLSATADFWLSRVNENADGTYSIANVVGADEYAQNVTDNAFTNAAAKENLLFAQKAAKELGLQPNPKWKAVGDKIRILSKDGITLEHASYKGETIKQADVNLLAFPLRTIRDNGQIKRDLDYYVQRVDPENGPAMAHGIFSLLYARLGEKEKAFESFKAAYVPNQRPPFGVLSETAKANNPYFATGAGAMVQAVLFGFGGLDLNDDGIVMNKGALPIHWKSLTIKGVGLNNETIKITQ